MSDASAPALSRERALGLVLVSYVMAIVAFALTLIFAPIDDLLWRTLAADAVATVVIFGWSYAYDNSSFYDAYWSVIPPIIVLYWMGMAEPQVPAARMLMIFAVILVWGARLTWNWTRGWTGMGHEDWRYADFRTQFPGFYWAISFAGVHFFPTLIVFAGMAAAYPALVTSGRAPRLGSTPSRSPSASAASPSNGSPTTSCAPSSRVRRSRARSLRTGLWRYSRHPNYLGEMMIWWSLFLFGLAADPGWATYAILAPAGDDRDVPGLQHPRAREAVAGCVGRTTRRSSTRPRC